MISNNIQLGFHKSAVTTRQRHRGLWTPWLIFIVRGALIDPRKAMDVNGTLWLCQSSYWKWPLIVDFPIKNGDFQ